MTEVMVILKRKELRALKKNELVDRIRAFPNQKFLNQDEEGEMRKHPIGNMAKAVKENGYEMTDEAYEILIEDFAALTLPKVKVTGSRFQKFNPRDIAVEEGRRDGTITRYPTAFMLQPEEGNGVKVMAGLKDDGMVQIGYLPAKFRKKYPVTKEMTVTAEMIDYSNGKFKNMSYQMYLDLERLATAEDEQV